MSKEEYTEKEIYDAVDDIVYKAFLYTGFNKVGEFVSQFGKPALKGCTEKHWNRRIK